MHHGQSANRRPRAGAWSSSRSPWPLVGIVLVMAGCGETSGPPTTGLAVLPNKVLHISGTAREALTLELVSDRCPVLRPDATATLNGRAGHLYVGGPNRPGASEGSCTYPFASFSVQTETATTLELVLSDPTQSITARLVGYHPFRFEPGDLPSPTVRLHDAVTLVVVRLNETLTVAVPPKPEMPDEITVSFHPRVSPSPGVAWTVAGTLAGSEVTFTIPGDSFVGQVG